MPRRQYIADLNAACIGALPPGITNVKAGEDDGMFEFVFTNTLGFSVSITAMIPELSAYPKTHAYMLFCSENASEDISKSVQEMRGKDRKTVFELLDIISAALSQKLDKDGDSQMQDSQLDYEEYNDEDIYDSDHEDFAIAPLDSAISLPPQGNSSNKTPVSSRDFRQRIRSDLRAAKEAGFKVGHLGNLLDGGNAYVTVSVRVAKLGISEEAMQAWQVEPSDYLILVIQYPNGYKSNESFQGLNSHHLPSNLCMRVVTCKHYKPTIQEAIKAFTTVRKNESKAQEAETESTLRDTFISKPLAKMLQERLVPILRFRGMGMDWQGAEGWYQQMAGAGLKDQNDIPAEFFLPECPNNALPDIVNADHYSTPDRKSYSFPLLAMQFMVRHFARCTEFCLVCHRKLDDEVEAIKPYVCDRGLCLFQLLSLGFGPSIEHEVMAQPYVVDLLVSFCYNSAAARKLKNFPDGLDIMVRDSPSECLSHILSFGKAN